MTLTSHSELCVQLSRHLVTAQVLHHLTQAHTCMHTSTCYIHAHRSATIWRL